MEQVKCISNYGIQDYLTMGNIYNVIRAEVDLGGEKFYIMNDQNKLDWYLGGRFIKIDNTQTIELRKEPIKSATQSLAETQTNNEAKMDKIQSNMKNFETLEVGKTYKNRLGELVKITNFKETNILYKFIDENGKTYMDDGLTFRHKYDGCDLIELIENKFKIELRKDLIKSATQCLAKTQTNNELKTEKKQTDRKIRVFESGAIRSDNTGRERFDFISPLALKELASYLSTTENAFAQTNYMKGIPEDACIESLLRHINDYQLNGKKSEAIALLFNAVALVHTIALKERGEYVKVQEGTKLVSESEYKNLNVTYNYIENN
jgi:hypothetical protein